MRSGYLGNSWMCGKNSTKIHIWVWSPGIAFLAFKSETLLIPNWILMWFVKNFLDFHQKFPDEKLCQKYFFELRNLGKFSKGKSMKIDFQNFEISFISLWKQFGDFGARKIFLIYFFDRKFLMKIQKLFYKSHQNSIWDK